jgi:dolichol kinase
MARKKLPNIGIYSNLIGYFTLSNTSHTTNSEELKSEVLRKIIHFLIALSPSMAAINKPLTVMFLMAGTLSYTIMEYLRLSGVKVPLISSLTGMASRSRDIGRFVMGPVTLGLGALLALLMYPSPAAAIGIYALAFGDGFASLVGKFFGKTRPAFLYGKSIEGSMACFAAVFISAYAVSGNTYIAIIAASAATAIEALPLEDYDNILIPIAVGLAVQFASL